MSGDNVVSLRPPAETPSDVSFAPEGGSASSDEGAVANLMAFCERLDEGMKHVASVLVQMDARLRRLELAFNKMEREKAKPAIYNHAGERVS